ncbi:MAG: hypothetical protein HYS89_02500 [Candidatus Colwellbacteria bacterium]|nr:hypothetical protein [Candidatus Colwellbacteria bacterium]
MGNKKLITIIVVLILLALGAGFWFWSQKGGRGISPQLSVPTAKELSPAEIKGSLGGQIFEQTQNPLKNKLPPTNPFEKTETNPLKDVYQNPF